MSACVVCGSPAERLQCDGCREGRESPKERAQAVQEAGPRIYRFDVVPMGKPRQTRSDKWKRRPAVLRYRAFADKLRVEAARTGFRPKEAGMYLRFWIPMPESWSKKRKRAMIGRPHRQRPDADNLEKAFLDALLEEDSAVWHIAGREKRWHLHGAIEVEIHPPPPEGL